MKNKKTTPSALLLFTAVPVILLTSAIGYVMESLFITDVMTHWVTWTFFLAWLVLHGEEWPGKYKAGLPKFIKAVIFLYTAVLSWNTLGRLYGHVIFNPELLTGTETLFAKATLFACLWLVTSVAVFKLMSIAVSVSDKINQCRKALQ